MPLIFVTLLLTVILSCKTGSTTVNNTYSNDTLVLVKKESAFTITGKVSSQLLFELQKGNNPMPGSTGKILLLLNEPSVKAAPDGVYAVYLINSLMEVDKLSASQSYFVALLDLYSFTAPGAKQQIELDITSQVNILQQQNQSPIYLVFRFDPLQLADGTISSITGSISFSGLSVISIRK